MFLRWQYRKTTSQRVSKVYVYRDTEENRALRRVGKPFAFPTKESEILKVALVESYRVNGQPRTRVIAYLGSFDPRRPVTPRYWTSRSIMARMRALDIPLDLKARFLKEIEARGVEFDWPASLEPITPEEQRELDAKEQELDTEFAALMNRTEGP